MRSKRRAERARIASYVGPHSFAPYTRAALEALGYEVVSAFAMGRFDDASWQPELRLADERHLAKLPDRVADPDTPIVLLTGARDRDVCDPRVAGTVRKPAELNDVYALLQRCLEQTPRRLPRVDTVLSARCIRADHRWVGNVVTLSEGGCLFRSSEALEPGECMNLQFALPRNGIISTRGRVVHVLEGAAGIAFSEPSLNVRRHIGDFVVQRLATR